MTNKVPTTNRIRVTLDKVVYCSSEILRDEQLKPLLMRCQQVMAIRKGEQYAVHKRLGELLSMKPEHFMSGSRRVIQDLIGASW